LSEVWLLNFLRLYMYPRWSTIIGALYVYCIKLDPNKCLTYIYMITVYEPPARVIFFRKAYGSTGCKATYPYTSNPHGRGSGAAKGQHAANLWRRKIPDPKKGIPRKLEDPPDIAMKNGPVRMIYP
jgi:hypothetical protein